MNTLGIVGAVQYEMAFPLSQGHMQLHHRYAAKYQHVY